MGDNISTVGDNISTVEGIQYCGGIPSVLWGDNSSTCGGIASVLWGDTFSTVEVVQYSGGITSVQWGDSFSTSVPNFCSVKFTSNSIANTLNVIFRSLIWIFQLFQWTGHAYCTVSLVHFNFRSWQFNLNLVLSLIK